MKAPASNQYCGTCSCGSTRVTIELPKSLESYIPRACDCEFCTTRKIEYLSHPDGRLHIESDAPLKIQRQGSNQADFITCDQCNDVIAASLEHSGSRIGALNATLLDEYSRLGEPQVVSPRLLSADEKVTRWADVWLAVSIK